MHGHDDIAPVELNAVRLQSSVIFLSQDGSFDTGSGTRVLATSRLEKIVEVTLFAGDATAAPEILVVSVDSAKVLGPHAGQIDKATGGAIQRLLDCGEIQGKTGETTTVLAPNGLSATHLVVVGLGESCCIRDAFCLGTAAVRSIAGKPRKHVLFALDVDWDEAMQEAAVAGAMMASHGQDIYREEKKRHAPSKIEWADFNAGAIKQGQILGEAVNLTRRLVNTPAQDMYPESFAEEALQIAEGNELGIEIWDQAKLREQRCEALLSVSRGSSRAPRLVIMKYRGGTDDSKPLALVGKGVTFDSGGLSLKPSDGMKTMKCDMAGAATVLGAMQAIAKLKLPINVIGVMGLVENMVGPDSYKLGDVLTARSGRTIEVLNTDAEGRLVLADALNVTVELGAERIIDLATLTGACVVALGTEVTGVMSNDDAWCEQVLSASKQSGEYAWQLPMFPEFGKQIRSEIADIKNIGEGRWGGAITAGKFLEEFVSDVPWVHLDIAGPSFVDRAKPWSEAGASGVMLRTLVEVVRSLA